MGQSDSEIKTKLLGQYAAMLDDKVEQANATKRLTDIEELAYGRGRKLAYK